MFCVFICASSIRGLLCWFDGLLFQKSKLSRKFTQDGREMRPAIETNEIWTKRQMSGSEKLFHQKTRQVSSTEIDFRCNWSVPYDSYAWPVVSFHLLFNVHRSSRAYRVFNYFLSFKLRNERFNKFNTFSNIPLGSAMHISALALSMNNVSLLKLIKAKRIRRKVQSECTREICERNVNFTLLFCCSERLFLD